MFGILRQHAGQVVGRGMSILSYDAVWDCYSLFQVLRSSMWTQEAGRSLCSFLDIPGLGRTKETVLKPAAWPKVWLEDEPR